MTDLLFDAINFAKLYVCTLTKITVKIGKVAEKLTVIVVAAVVVAVVVSLFSSKMLINVLGGLISVFFQYFRSIIMMLVPFIVENFSFGLKKNVGIVKYVCV